MATRRVAAGDLAEPVPPAGPGELGAIFYPGAHAKRLLYTGRGALRGYRRLYPHAGPRPLPGEKCLVVAHYQISAGDHRRTADLLWVGFPIQPDRRR
ncbi:MAG: HAMP domain-containing protein [Anaerolineales bacterium]